MRPWINYTIHGKGSIMMDIKQTFADELREEARFLEPSTNLIPKWVADNFEDRGGVFAGKVQYDDGWVSFTGIERFTDDYVTELNMALVGRQLSAA